LLQLALEGARWLKPRPLCCLLQGVPSPLVLSRRELKHSDRHGTVTHQHPVPDIPTSGDPCPFGCPTWRVERPFVASPGSKRLRWGLGMDVEGLKGVEEWEIDGALAGLSAREDAPPDARSQASPRTREDLADRLGGSGIAHSLRTLSERIQEAHAPPPNR